MDLKSKVQAALTQRPKFPSPPADGDGILDDHSAKAATLPVEARKSEGQGRGAKVPVGSRVAPVRRSSADMIDGRAARATGRNSRLNIALRPEYLDVFKDECIAEGVSFCSVIEEMIEQRWPKLFKK